ncbi:MAG: ribonuclease E/G [Lachnospiraceae bacterium]|nr:ribonuclease E/G [Lachnospiraceae bacterium]
MSRSILGTNHISYSDEALTEEKKGDGKLLITTLRGGVYAFLIKGNRLIAVSAFSQDELLGNVYVGRVKDVVPGINAAFVDISKDVTCFLNLNIDRKLKQGDLILVQIKALAQKEKYITVSTEIKLPKAVKKEVIERANYLSAYSLVYKASDENAIKLLNKHFFDNEYNEIVTDIEAVYEKLNALKNAPALRLYTDNEYPLSKLYSLETKLSEGLNRKVWLKNGGYLIFDTTEAMTVIDVNSGKNNSKKTEILACFELNCEAAEEIALQLRLRNISGIIIIDFVNMASDEYNELLLQKMKEFTDRDRLTVKVIDITPLGLMELTRRKESRSLYETFRD